MTFTVHPQIACEESAGRYFLVAYGCAKETLPYLREINETGAFYWELAVRGYDLGGMLTEASKIYDVPRYVLEVGIMSFFNDLAEKGYVTRDEE